MLHHSSVGIVSRSTWNSSKEYLFDATYGDNFLAINIHFTSSSVCRGVVAVSVDMLQMDINQCDDDYFIPNAFKGTHKCDQKTSYVSFNSGTRRPEMDTELNTYFFSLLSFSSVFRFWDVYSQLAATNANACKATSIRLKI